MRTIDGDALSDWMKDYGQKCIKGERKISLMYVWKHIQDMQTIEERKTGEWIVVHPTKESTEYVACDQCGQVEAWDENVGMLCALVGERYAHFCPNCGARMSGGEQPCN